ncbi:hypothetical protein D3M59_09535 [Sphingomonas edaphi]|uniref:Uncharacterized protein n=1 Tax=Sphingomonas edaphi TaxID=2315689 RepID=A0A418PYD8_9SPHN|nr:hypothetical protein D3M59_09535 [Sphingomonas edaphi]
MGAARAARLCLWLSQQLWPGSPPAGPYRPAATANCPAGPPQHPEQSGSRPPARRITPAGAASALRFAQRAEPARDV